MTPCQKLGRYKKALRGGVRACNNLPQPPKTKDVGIGLRKIVACSHSSSQCLLVTTVFGMVSEEEEEEEVEEEDEEKKKKKKKMEKIAGLADFCIYC